jgi:hypothetical protein
MKGHLTVPIAIVIIMGAILIPLPTIVLDLLISTNIALSVVILLSAVYILKPVQFSVFPQILLISTLFLVLSVTHRIPWRVTAVVFGRDLIILVICTLVYATTPLRDFRPTLLGKANTVAQIVTLGATILVEVEPWFWIVLMKWIGIWTVFALTIVSALHYVYLLGVRLRAVGATERAGARPS